MKCFIFLNSPKQYAFLYEYTPSLCIGIGDKIKKIRCEKYILDPNQGSRNLIKNREFSENFESNERREECMGKRE